MFGSSGLTEQSRLKKNCPFFSFSVHSGANTREDISVGMSRMSGTVKIDPYMKIRTRKSEEYVPLFIALFLTYS